MDMARGRLGAFARDYVRLGHRWSVVGCRWSVVIYPYCRCEFRAL